MRTARAWLDDLGGRGGEAAAAGMGYFGGAGQGAGCSGNYASMSKVVAKIEKLLSTL